MAIASLPALTLWAATVRHQPLAGRLLAAQAGGFTAQSVFPHDVKNWLDEGHTLAGIREQARAGGAPLTVLDPFTRWLPRWHAPAGASADTLALVDTEETTFYDYAAGLQVRSMTVIETFGTKYELSELVAAFERTCDAARERDLLVQVEFMPFGSIPDLATAWEIVRRAGRDNGGLVFDTWHYFRTQPDPALLAQVPGEKLFAVQVADAATAPQGGSLLADQMHFRRVPGEGDFPLTGVIDLLRANGGLRDVGPELFSDELDALAPAVVGARVGAAMRQLLATEIPTP
jgi:sugar phosphate isomerase/epimerase